MTTAAPTRLRRTSGLIGDGGLPARRALIRWSWRLFRAEWRQQLLIAVLVGVAVAATVLASAIAQNAAPTTTAATFGAANKLIQLPGTDPQLTADVALVQRTFGPTQVIENQTLTVPGTATTVDLRAQDPQGPFGRPTLALLSGRYPLRGDEVAITPGVAALLDLRPGRTVRLSGRTWHVVGEVENPADLLDQFALVRPGQVAHASKATILFDASPAAVADFRLPGGQEPTMPPPPDQANALGPATLVLLAAVVGLILIGLLAAAGFTIIAQRRRRALGMLAAVGASTRQLRLVTLSAGTLVGAVGTLVGALAGLAAWTGYRPLLQRSVEHRVPWSHLPAPVIGIAAALAIVATTLAAWRPARAAARLGVGAALSGRPDPPARRNRGRAAAVVTGIGLGCLAAAGGWGPGRNVLLLAVGVALTSIGAVLLVPLALRLPAACAGHLPAAARIALRDLDRHRSRAGAVLAAVTFAVYLAVVICVLATAAYGNPLTNRGPNLSANQLIIYQPHGPGSGYSGVGPPPPAGQEAALQAKVQTLARSWHARYLLPLYSAGRPTPAPNTLAAATNQRATLWQARGPSGTLTRGQAGRVDSANFQGPVYVATPALLRDYGIDPGQIHPDTDVLTVRRGLADVANLELLGQGDIASTYTPDGHQITETHRCPPKSCLSNPRVQTVSELPTGTSAPNTVITEHAVHALGQQPVLDGWLIQAPTALTPAQTNAARQLALSAETRVETPVPTPDLDEIRNLATAGGIAIAALVLALGLGLLRGEAGRDLRTLTAIGAGSRTRRVITAATGGTLATLGALLGTALAYAALAVWAHGSLDTTLRQVPVTNLTILLLGLPATATLVGALLGGQEPRRIARQPID